MPLSVSNLIFKNIADTTSQYFKAGLLPGNLKIAAPINTSIVNAYKTTIRF